jgi:hypothetical protein
MELAESMLDDTQTSPENAPTRFSGIDLFLRGIGSVLEFFPPVERLDVWGATQAVPVVEWPVLARGLLAELRESMFPNEDNSNASLNNNHPR